MTNEQMGRSSSPILVAPLQEKALLGAAWLVAMWLLLVTWAIHLLPLVKFDPILLVLRLM